MYKLIHKHFNLIFRLSIQITTIFFTGLSCVSMAYGWTTQEHREMVPHRDDFNLSHEQFNVGKGDVFTGERDRWRYAHLLVAADFFQNWKDFRNAPRTLVINARHTIDQNNRGSTNLGLIELSNHDLITFVRGNVGFIDVGNNNRDHFQPYAQRRWRSMHAEAIKKASDSLKGALALNGFADHFLADTFAAGHQIDYTEYRQEGGRTGVKDEHDRLNETGLAAQNLRGDQWEMLGDGHFHKMEQKGREIVIEAIALSIDDIFLAASGKTVPMINGKYRAERLIPIIYDDEAEPLVHGGCDFPPCGFQLPDDEPDITQNFEPEMVKIPAGTFQMGCVSGIRCKDEEYPVHRVQITAFEIGKYEVTFAEWYACVNDGGCDPDTEYHVVPDADWDLEKQPAQWRSWDDAQQYVRWLSRKTGKQYRLPSESEWEYAARAGTSTPYSFNGRVSTDKANYAGNSDNYSYTFEDIIDGGAENDVNRNKALPGGSFQANPWGLHEVHGNVSEWTQDCWHDNYVGAPRDGSAWERGGDCSKRTWRGGNYNSTRTSLRSANRNYGSPSLRLTHGFRVARTLSPISPAPPIGSDMSLTFAKLILRSNLYDDQVYIDGKWHGSTPVNVELQARKHSIVIIKDGYKRYEKIIELNSGEQRTIRARLEKRPTRVSFEDVEYNCSSLANKIGDFHRERQRTMSDLANTIVESSFPEDLSKIEFELGHTVSDMNVLICIDKSFPSEKKLEFSQILPYLAVGEYREGKCDAASKHQFKQIINKSGASMPIFLTFDSGVYETGITTRKTYSGGIKESGYMQVHTNRLDFSPFSRGIQSNIFSYDETDDDYTHSVSCLCLLDVPLHGAVNCINR